MNSEAWKSWDACQLPRSKLLKNSNAFRGFCVGLRTKRNRARSTQLAQSSHFDRVFPMTNEYDRKLSRTFQRNAGFRDELAAPQPKEDIHGNDSWQGYREMHTKHASYPDDAVHERHLA